jgi:hypothetical protein
MLFSYLQTLQGMIRDRQQKEINPADLIRYVNRARREIAMRSQSIRLIPPISGPVQQILVTLMGTGYTNPSVAISSPDLPSGQRVNPAGAQATATAIVIAGRIASISVGYGGDGYVNPTVRITDPTGSGATAIATTVPVSTLNPNQEEYLFSDIPVAQIPGVRSVFATIGHYILYSNYRYRLVGPLSVSQFKSFIENYPFQYYYVPTACAQRGQGTSGSLLMYPIPSQKYPWEPDCLCLPTDLTDDGQIEALPEPWSDIVPTLAASKAFEEMQSYNNARYWREKADEEAKKYSAYARPFGLQSIYGRS